jgi:hypothetical protein
MELCGYRRHINLKHELWGSETPSSSIPDLGVAIVPIVLAARTFAQVV